MVYDVGEGKGDWHLHVFVSIKRSLEVHVLDVGSNKACPWCADGAVPEEFQ